MDWDKVSTELNKKLDPAAVKPAKSFGPKGDYIEGWHAIAEANRIFGFGEWDQVLRDVKCVSERPRKIGKAPAEKDGWAVSYIASVTVMVGGVKREDVGAGHGYDIDCGLAHESAIKEAVTDALKRTLRTFGNPFGLALYDKSRENVGVDLPTATEAEISTACDAINSIGSMSDLRKYWDKLWENARHVADHPQVTRAKDARKAKLTPGAAQ